LLVGETEMVERRLSASSAELQVIQRNVLVFLIFGPSCELTKSGQSSAQARPLLTSAARSGGIASSSVT
jgi:hypothetical protein